MKSMKWWFVFVMTTVTVLIVFAIADFILAGLIALAVSIWDNVTALQTFKWAFSLLFLIESVLTVPAVIKSCKGDKTNGS